MLRPEGQHFADVVRGLKAELGDEHDILEHLAVEGAKMSEIADQIRKVKPRLVILMDNRIIQVYRKYQASLPDTGATTPSISLMAASLDVEIAGLRRATGISYEIPIVTSVLNMRSLANKPIPKIGIIHREFLRAFIAENSVYCRKEGIAIAAVSLRNKEHDFEASVRKALTSLLEVEKVDALWIPNDNVLLSPEILRKVWIPMLDKQKKPAIVGVESLVTPKLGFGTFAVLPDHLELGKQLAQRVLEISDAGYLVESGTVQRTLSVIKVLNLRQARKIISIDKARLGSVDIVLE